MSPIQNPASILIIVDHAERADRLITALAPDEYNLETILFATFPVLLQPQQEPDLVLAWFPYSSPDALTELQHLISQARSLRQSSPIPVLLIVDQYGSHWVEPAFQLGVDDILTRPIHPLVLRKRVQLLLRAREIERAEERFRTVADFTYDWEYWIDQHQQFVYCSPACQRITGYPPEAFLTNPEMLINICEPTDLARLQAHFKAEKTSPDALTIDFRINNSAKEVRWISHACQPVYGKDHRSLGRRVSNRDITERKAAEDALVTSERLAAIGRLTASLAHEINNPLQAMCANMELALDFPLSAEERESYLRIVMQEIERLMEINRRVLDFTRPAVEARQALPVGPVLERALQLAHSQLKKAGIETQVALPADLPEVKIPADQLAQVFLNLIMNAVDAMPSGGLLTVSSVSNNLQVQLIFKDTGAGFQPDVLPFLFEPFYTTKQTGSGLGLAISQSILERSEGQIHARNHPEGGAEFTISLPIAFQDEIKPG